jgi:DMSO/TMAO reductase YedYZ molybdopterin-dependent catalytic subunit
LKKHLFLILLSISLILASALLGVFILSVEPTKLNDVEITEYQGKKLSPISDIYDNAINGTQYLNVSTYRLSVYGLVDRNLTLTYSEVLENYKHYQKVVTLYCVDGWYAKILWEGFLLKDLLDQAGVHPNAKALIFYAADGYSTSLPIDYIINRSIIIAYKMNGVTLPVEKGYPFQLVAEDKFGYKWIKWITRIEVSNNTKYLGYWEQRGDPNSGDLNSTFPGEVAQSP